MADSWNFQIIAKILDDIVGKIWKFVEFCRILYNFLNHSEIFTKFIYSFENREIPIPRLYNVDVSSAIFSP